MSNRTKIISLVLLVFFLFPSVNVLLAQNELTVITTAKVKLREGPGTQFKQLATIPSNTTLTAIGRNAKGTWLQVRYNDLTGWVSVRFLKWQGNINTLADVNAPPPQPTAQPSSPSGGADPAQGSVTVNVHNKLSVGLTLHLRGPATYSVSLAAGQSTTISVVPGDYTFSAFAPGFSTLTGSKSWGSGGSYDWDFFVQ